MQIKRVFFGLRVDNEDRGPGTVGERVPEQGHGWRMHWDHGHATVMSTEKVKELCVVACPTCNGYGEYDLDGPDPHGTPMICPACEGEGTPLE